MTKDPASVCNSLEDSLQDPTPQTDPQWMLCAVNGRLSGHTFPLKLGINIVGRDPECDVRISGTALSRHHARLIAKHEEVVVSDLSNNQATYVDGDTVERAVLQDGSEVRFDVHTFVLKQIVSIESAIPPSAPKLNSDGSKQWLTKPTSPGNREEPAPETDSSTNKLISLLSVVAVILAIVSLGYVLGFID